MDNPQTWFASHGLDAPARAAAGAMAQVIEAALAEMKGREDLYALIVADLNASGLLGAEMLSLPAPPS